MAFQMTHSEARRLETSIATVLRSFKAGDLDEVHTIEFVRQLIDAAANDDHSALTDWLYSEHVKCWLEAHATR